MLHQFDEFQEAPVMHPYRAFVITIAVIIAGSLLIGGLLFSRDSTVPATIELEDNNLDNPVSVTSAGSPQQSLTPSERMQSFAPASHPKLRSLTNSEIEALLNTKVSY